MPFLTTTDQTALYYTDWGQGRPVVFVTGWALSSDMWAYQRAYLDDRGQRSIAFDRRGHGRSDDPGQGYDYDTLADDLAALMEHLDLRDVTLVAHSMGGGELIRYLTRHGRDRVAGVVLVAATLPFPMKTADTPDGFDRAVIEMVRNMWRRDYCLWLDDNAAAYVGEGLPGCSVSAGLTEWTKRDMMRTSLKAVLDCNLAMIETDFRTELRDIDVATLIIQGDHDASIPLELSGKRTVELIPGARLKVYDNAPHGLYLSHRDQLNEDLLDFVKR